MSSPKKSAVAKKWATHTEKQKIDPSLTSAAKTTDNMWMGLIAGGKDPKTASSGWDSNYEVVGSKATLTLCTVHKVGSHKAPAGFPANS